MTDPFIVGPAAPLEADPIESFENMEKEIEEAAADQQIGDPVLPCRQPYVEVWLANNDPAPVPGADCAISLPTGKSGGGKLDASGYLKIENLDVDDPDLENVMALGIAHGAKSLEIRFTKDAPVTEPSDDEEEDIPEEPPLYFKPSF